MARTADRLVVIGRGRLIAQGTVDEIVRMSTSDHVRVLTAQPAVLAGLIHDHGGAVDVQADDALVVTGMECRDVGIIAGAAGVTLYELSPQSASLEEAFMELTRDAAEYRSGADGAASASGGLL
jgi:ABC-2 type transport system ATP-binding protein